MMMQRVLLWLGLFPLLVGCTAPARPPAARLFGAPDVAVAVPLPSDGHGSHSGASAQLVPDDVASSADRALQHPAHSCHNQPTRLTACSVKGGPQMSGSQRGSTWGSAWQARSQTGFVAAVTSLGDLVWYDANNNGVVDGSAAGIDGVIVELYADADADGTPDGTTPLATTTTSGGGRYRFNNLASGTYVVYLPGSNFDGGALGGYDSSTGAPAATGPYEPGKDSNTDIDNDDNGSNVGGIISRPVTLTPGGEPTGDGDGDANSNLTVDFGMFRYVSLGDLVWNDVDNNGVVNGGEAGIDGVTVELYLDMNADGVPDSPTPLATTTTSGGGYYLFDTLYPGTYVVSLPGSNFAAGGPLAGFATSTGRAAYATGPYEPGAAPNNDTDNDDNGSGSGGRIVSGPVTLISGSEPTTDGDSDPDSNLTVDFGVFRPASLGSIVWDDTNHNGQRDQGEAGVPNVTVTLYDASVTALATTATDGAGFYTFTNLPPGTYSIGFSGLPPGYSFTLRDVGADTSDSDVDPATGRTVPTMLVPGQNDPTWWAGVYASPTAISLVSFTAERGVGAVVVRWTTGAELNAWSFDLLRSSDGTRASAVRVTPQAVPATGRGSAGASYVWVDYGVQPGTTYSYWLVERSSGDWAEYGPARATTVAGGVIWVHLPMAGQ
jgi:protocatechuate 3,4-dioxygenase beta subunit